MEMVTGRLPLKPAEPSRYDIGAAPTAILLSSFETIANLFLIAVCLLFALAAVTIGLPFFLPDYPLTASLDSWLQILSSNMHVVSLGAIGALVVAFVLPTWIGYRKKLKAQLARDAAPLSSGPFVLILRPFHTDARIGMPHPFLQLGFESAIDSSGGMHAPEYVARVLERYIDVRQIGGNREDIAASRMFTSDDDWQAVLATQAVEASAIVIMPLVTKRLGERKTHGTSTVWELEHLCATGALAKTALLLPPWEYIGGIAQQWYIRGRLKKEWRQVQAAAAKFGLDLPAYNGDSDVLLFSQEANGRWAARSGHRGAATDLARNLLDAMDELTMRSGIDLAAGRAA
ncbi:MAG: hypothetical protein AB7T59_16675 [Hyphomonadaceae bacterium]